MEAFALRADAPRVPLPHRLLSDDRLLRLVAAGNAQAFGTVYARYHAPLYAYCRSIVRDPDDARDALQSTMMKALAALSRSGEREIALKPWLFRIAHNESISLMRKRKPTEQLTDAVSPPVAGVDTAVVERERLGQLVSDLQALPERQRGALIMREVNGLSYDEIAGVLSISAGAARQTVFEARTTLAEYSEGRDVACENIRRSISDGDRRALRARRVRAHLRACNGCRDFQTTLTTRRRDLAALTPGLSGASVVALLQGVLGSGAAVGGGGAVAGGAGLLGAGAAKSMVAVVAVTAAGTGAVKLADTGTFRDAAVARSAPAAAEPSKASGPTASSDAGRSGGDPEPAALGLAGADERDDDGDNDRGRRGGDDADRERDDDRADAREDGEDRPSRRSVGWSEEEEEDEDSEDRDEEPRDEEDAEDVDPEDAEDDREPVRERSGSGSDEDSASASEGKDEFEPAEEDEPDEAPEPADEPDEPDEPDVETDLEQ